MVHFHFKIRAVLSCCFLYALFRTAKICDRMSRFFPVGSDSQLKISKSRRNKTEFSFYFPGRNVADGFRRSHIHTKLSNSERVPLSFTFTRALMGEKKFSSICRNTIDLYEKMQRTKCFQR